MRPAKTNNSSRNARSLILERVAAATAGRAQTPHPGALKPENRSHKRAPTAQTGSTPNSDPVDAFADRFQRSGGEVVMADAGWGGAELKGWLHTHAPEVATIAIAPDLPASLRPDLPVVAAREAGAGVSVGSGAVAETGSLILRSTGSRAVQLLPPLHIIWVRAEHIVFRLEEAFANLTDNLPAAIGLHSGPSKSADIGRTVVTGVHGPGRSVAIVVGRPPGR